jgi:hypothetical protein
MPVMTFHCAVAWSYGIALNVKIMMPASAYSRPRSLHIESIG